MATRSSKCPSSNCLENGFGMQKKHRSKNKKNPQKKLEIVVPIQLASVAKTAAIAEPFPDFPKELDIAKLTDIFHEEVRLRDVKRIQTFRQAIGNNCHLFIGKIVLDVNCGLGILSLMAAHAGAHHVYAIESSSLAELARQVVIDNGMTERITVIHGAIQDIELSATHVDVILSDWMGHCLFYKSKLDAVLFARNKWLQPHGIVFPNRFLLFIAAVKDGHSQVEHIGFWNHKIHQFDVSAMRRKALGMPILKNIAANQVISSPSLLREYDIYKMNSSDTELNVGFDLLMAEKDFVHAFAIYFTAHFTHGQRPVVFDTAPGSSPRNRHSLFYLDQYLTVDKGDRLDGTFGMTRNGRKETKDDLQVKTTFMFNNKSSHLNGSHSYYFREQ